MGMRPQRSSAQRRKVGKQGDGADGAGGRKLPEQRGYFALWGVVPRSRSCSMCSEQGLFVSTGDCGLSAVMVRQWQSLFYDSHYMSTEPERKSDYVKLAEGFGAHGFRGTTEEELRSALQQALTMSRPLSLFLLSYGTQSSDRPRCGRPPVFSSRVGIFHVEETVGPGITGGTVENKKTGLTNDRRSCRVAHNRKQNRYDDREKISSERFRELPGAARQRRRGRCYWPSSTSVEPVLSG